MVQRSGFTGVLLVDFGLPVSDSGTHKADFVNSLIGFRNIVPAGLFGHVAGKGALKKEAKQLLFPVLDGMWGEGAWPYVQDCKRLVQSLNGLLSDQGLVVRYGSCVGEPSLAKAVADLTTLGCSQLLALPLRSHVSPNMFIHFKEQVGAVVRQQGFAGEWTVVPGFSSNTVFLRAFAAAVLHAGFSPQGSDRLLLTFDSAVKGCVRAAEPRYRAEVQRTAKSLAALLDVPAERVLVTFRRPFGTCLDWMEPFAADVLTDLRTGDQPFAGRVFVAWPSVLLDCPLQDYDLNTHLVNAPGLVRVPAMGRSRATLKVLESVISDALEQQSSQSAGFPVVQPQASE